jgi:hypothetical protein
MALLPAPAWQPPTAARAGRGPETARRSISATRDNRWRPAPRGVLVRVTDYLCCIVATGFSLFDRIAASFDEPLPVRARNGIRLVVIRVSEVV